MLFLVLGTVIFVACWIDANNIDKENRRLEDIVSEVYEAIEDENYTLARAKTANIVFSGSTTTDGEQAVEKWDKTRTELLAVIDSAEKSNNNKNDVSKEIIDTPTEEPTKSQDIPENDNVEVEKATENLNANNNVDNSTEETTKHQEQSLNGTMNIENTEETSEFSDFTYGYEKAEFDKYNSYATENGLADTKIYIECTINEIEILEADGTESIIGYVTDEEENHWLVHMHVVPIVSETYFDKYIGKRVVMKGVYSGFSGKMQMPFMVLDEMLVVSDDTVINGTQKLLE